MTGQPTNVIPRSPIVAAVMARLNAVPNAVGYETQPINVPTTDAAGHVAPYWVLHTSTGTPSPEQDVAETAVDLDWWIQITCAGAFPADVTALVTRIDAALYRWEPAVTGFVCGRLVPPPGFDPGPLRLDRDVQPYRPFTVLQYQTRITAT